MNGDQWAVVLTLPASLVIVALVAIAAWAPDHPLMSRSKPSRLVFYPVWWLSLLVTMVVLGPFWLAWRVTRREVER